jgi:siroheme synthase-like protein
MMEKGQGANYFPLYVKMDGLHILVFGAGEIASRRLKALAGTSSRLTVVAPECSHSMKELMEEWGERITYVQDVYKRGCLVREDMDLVFAATDDAAVNEAIYRECRHRDIPVNVSTDHRLCDFYFPATVSVPDSELLVAIASTSASEDTHSQVKALREKIERDLGAAQA